MSEISSLERSNRKQNGSPCALFCFEEFFYIYILETGSPYLIVSQYEGAILKIGITKMTSLVLFATEIEREHNPLSSLMICFLRVILRRLIVFLVHKNIV
jgi:hypothetical protein